jgi:hypothetical protein
VAVAPQFRAVVAADRAGADHANLHGARLICGGADCKCVRAR